MTHNAPIGDIPSAEMLHTRSAQQERAAQLLAVLAGLVIAAGLVLAVIAARGDVTWLG